MYNIISVSYTQLDVYKRQVVSRRHDVIDMFAPSGMEHSELELREY